MAEKFLTRLFLFSTLLLILLVPITVSAIVIKRPVGGKVIAMLPITCPDGVEVFNIKPVSIVPPGPYYVSATTRRYKHFTIAPNKWILGFYNPVPTICFTDSIPPAPVPVFRITMFGSSIF